MMRALRVVADNGAFPPTVVMPRMSVCRAATTTAIASSWPGSQSRMMGNGAVGDISRKHATVTLGPMRSVRWSGFTAVLTVGVVVVGLGLAGCRDGRPADGGHDGTAANDAVTSLPLPTGGGAVDSTADTTGFDDGSSAEPSTTLPATLPAPEPTGVPGIDDEDPFCAAWARYTGSVQSVAIAAAFGGLDDVELASLEVVAAATLVAAVGEIESTWPGELGVERHVVVDDLLGPFERRAATAIALLREAGATDVHLNVLDDGWVEALRERDPTTPVIEAPGFDAALETLVGDAVDAFVVAVTPFPQDPSLTTIVADTPATDAYLGAQCPALADQGVGDAV